LKHNDASVVPHGIFMDRKMLIKQGVFRRLVNMGYDP